MTSESEPGDRSAFFERIRRSNLAPLWEVLGTLVPPEPCSSIRPAHWRYEEVRPELQLAARLVSAAEAERRVLVLENPATPGQSAITRTLYAGYQMLLPGETAPRHRHTATAVRLILEGRGARTTVDDLEVEMEPGDIIITPSWTYHDHFNAGSDTVVWLDGLDVPTVQMLEAGFCEKSHFPEPDHPPAREDAFHRHHRCLMPTAKAGGHARNPVLRYPYTAVRQTLQQLAARDPVDPLSGTKVELVNPITSGPATSTMSLFVQLLPVGFETIASRSTESAVYCVIEGNGESAVADCTFKWHPCDVFVVPPWTPVRHHADCRSVLFSFSDRALQRALNIWRERGA